MAEFGGGIVVLGSVQTSLGWINYLTLAAYLAGVIGIGVYFARREKSTDDFFRGGQRLPWWAAGLSIYATMLSSITYMAVPAKAYATDWAYSFNSVSILVVAPLVIYAYLPFFRRLNVTSAYEYLERRFNVAVRMFGSASFILLQIGRMAVVLYLPAIALAAVSTIDVYLCIIAMGILCVAYTVIGGIEAVIWTDVIQTIVLLAGALLSMALLIAKSDDGLIGMWQVATSEAKFFENVTWKWDVTAATASVVMIGSLFSNLVSYTASQDVVQRYMTTQDQSQAARAIWTNALLAVPSSALFFALGTALFVFYKSHPERLDSTLSPDVIFPQFIMHELPVGIGGVVIAGIFAAAQSTLSSSLNSVAAAWVTDFHVYFWPRTSDLGKLRMGQGLIVLLGLVATAAACLMARVGVSSAWDVSLKALGLTGGLLAGLFALGIFTRRAHGPGALVGVSIGAAAVFYVAYFTNTNLFLYAATGTVVCFTAGYLASLLIPATPKPLSKLTIYRDREGTSLLE